MPQRLHDDSHQFIGNGDSGWLTQYGSGENPVEGGPVPPIVYAAPPMQRQSPPSSLVRSSGSRHPAPQAHALPVLVASGLFILWMTMAAPLMWRSTSMVRGWGLHPGPGPVGQGNNGWRQPWFTVPDGQQGAWQHDDQKSVVPMAKSGAS